MANNPYVNKVQLADGTSLIDITDTTATASDVASGKYFYTSAGVKTQGTSSGSGDGYVWQDANGYVHLSDEEGTQITVDALTVSSSGTHTAPTGHAYSPVIVPSGTAGTPSATKGAVNNHSISVTPSVTNTTGWITGSTLTGTAVSVSASELVSGSETKTSNGTYDVTNLAELVVSVSGGSSTWSWKGNNATKVNTPLNEKVYLKDTAYATWTPTTTQTTLSSSSNLTTYSSVDFDLYSYIYWSRFHSHFEYSSVVNERATDFYFSGGVVVYGSPNSLDTMTAGTVGGAASNGLGTRYGLFYTDSSGIDKYGSQAGYGVFVTSYGSPIVSFSNGITPKTPNIYARCASTFFSETAASAVNKNTSFYENTIEIWRIDRGTTATSGLQESIRDMWLNGF